MKSDKDQMIRLGEKMSRKIRAARFHVAPGIGGINGTSIDVVRDKADITLDASGVLVKTKIGETLVPFSNVTSISLEPEANEAAAKDTRKTSTKN